MAIVLLVKTAQENTIELPILGSCIVGRSSRCDFTIKDEKMSGKHGVFEIDDSGALIYTDMGSSNGSFLNNSLITKAQLKINQVLLIGRTTIKIDEKKLNSREHLAVGVGVPPTSKEDLSLNVSKESRDKIVHSNAEPTQKLPSAKSWLKNKKVSGGIELEDPAQKPDKPKK